MSYYLETYGCSLNSADSDLIVGRLNALGYERVKGVEGAGIIILNTCGVKEPTEDRIIYRLEELSLLELPIIVTGCLPRISLERIKNTIPSYAALLGPQSVDYLGDIIPRILDGERGIIHLDSDPGSKLRFFEGPPDSTICTIPICEGCLGACAYCAVRIARGNVKSYGISELRAIVDRCVHLGYREIRLTSQDAGVYGVDTGENLVQLLRELDSIPGLHMFRLGMFNPNLVKDSIHELLEVMSSSHFFQFFHVPLQSGSDSILGAMNRNYTVSEWTWLIKEIQKHSPNATISTDIIVGFPGETDSDFEHTLQAIKTIRPTVVNVSKYGDRPATQASKAQNKVDSKIKKQRSKTLSKLVAEISLNANSSWVGWSGHVTVTDFAPRGGLLCRNQSYRPIVIKSGALPGDRIMVEVVSSARTYLIGQIIDET